VYPAGIFGLCFGRVCFRAGRKFSEVKMENHDEKFDFLMVRQRLRCAMKCAGCIGALSRYNGQKIDLDHIFPKCREGKSGERWASECREFGDSLLNLRLIQHDCHIGGKGEGTRYTDRDAKRFERILRTETFGQWTYGDVVNLRTDACYDDVCAVIDDVIEKFKEAL